MNDKMIITVGHLICLFFGCCLGLIIHSVKDKPCPKQPIIHKHVVKPLTPMTRQEYFQERIYQDFCKKEDLNFELCKSFIEHN